MTDEGLYDFKGVKPFAIGEEATWYAFCQEQRLMVQYCAKCDRHQFPPRSVCQECLSSETGWVEASGKGSVFTFTVQHRAAPGFSDQGPHVIAMIELEEGPRMMSRLVDIDQEVSIGSPVNLRWARIDEDFIVPVFVKVEQDV